VLLTETATGLDEITEENSKSNYDRHASVVGRKGRPQGEGKKVRVLLQTSTRMEGRGWRPREDAWEVNEN